MGYTLSRVLSKSKWDGLLIVVFGVVGFGFCFVFFL